MKSGVSYNLLLWNAKEIVVAELKVPLLCKWKLCKILYMLYALYINAIALKEPAVVMGVAL